jgi:hypothetical protein
MFTGEIIAVAFITVLVSANVLRFAEQIRSQFVIKVFTLILVIAGIYCFIAGAWMVGGWTDPLASMSAEEIDEVRPMSRSRAGILILVIQFWPYVLMLTGAGSVLGSYGISSSYIRSTKKELRKEIEFPKTVVV